MKLTDIKENLAKKSIRLVHVVAFDTQHCIGKDNQLAWHIPEDLQHFKALTTGGVVVMGRKTFESMGRPLPNRVNWVITRDKNWTAEGVKIAHSLSEGILLASDDVPKSQQPYTLFIIGGGDIFAQTLAIADTLEVSRIQLDVQGDAFYPVIGDEFVCTHQTHGISAKNGVAYCFESYQRKK
ncbi:MAG: dihydrofolate reductase [Moraxella sp.]|nr:dihydrofolate reductase [Moraxella sp.]